MQPMDATRLKLVAAGMETLDRVVRPEHPDLSSAYFAVKRAGWLRVGVGSAVNRKVLIRVEGPTFAPDDHVLLEVKEVTNLDGVRCLEGPTTPPAVRVIDGTRQLGRLKHDILAVGPTMLIPAAVDRAEHWLEWWVSSWEPSYHEVRLSDLRSVKDLTDIAFDAGVQCRQARLRTRTGALVQHETGNPAAEGNRHPHRGTARGMARAGRTMSGIVRWTRLVVRSGDAGRRLQESR